MIATLWPFCSGLQLRPPVSDRAHRRDRRAPRRAEEPGIAVGRVAPGGGEVGDLIGVDADVGAQLAHGAAASRVPTRRGAPAYETPMTNPSSSAVSSYLAGCALVALGRFVLSLGVICIRLGKLRTRRQEGSLIRHAPRRAQLAKFAENRAIRIACLVVCQRLVLDPFRRIAARVPPSSISQADAGK